MPLYDYHCESCGRTTEVLQRRDEPPLTVCPHCTGPVRKMVSAPAFHLKGSGWYATDYAKKSGSSGADAKSGSGESSPVAESSKASSDSKSGSESSPTAPAAPAAPSTPKSGDS